MAIPFFEPRNEESTPSAAASSIDAAMMTDQVDGPAPMQPQAAPTNAAASSNTSAGSNSMPNADGISSPSSSMPASSSSSSSSSPPPADELNWRRLATAMCKVMQEYYVQNASTNTPFTSAVVQITPNGQVKPMWK